MKMMTLFLAAGLLLAGLLPPEVRAEAGSREALLAAARAGDREAGLAAEEALREEGGAGAVSFEELFLLSRALYAVCGNRTFPDEWRLCVGEVILNRVASPEFPDTLAGVIEEEELYFGKAEGYFDALRPDSLCAEAALRLLEGERVMDEPSVVYQDEHFYDGGVFKSLYDYRAGDIHFCCSTRPELYG